MFLLLEEAWSFSGEVPLNFFQCAVGADKFRTRTDFYREDWKISLALRDKFICRIEEEETRSAMRVEKGLKETFDELSEYFQRKDQKVSRDVRKSRNRLIGKLRMLLAEVCIDALEPDLVILDEFQRFKHLLNPETEAGELSRQLFEWSDANAVARVLLLSATPYKAYTLQHEAEEDNHYEDFIRTIEFLQNESESSTKLRGLFKQFRRQIYKLGTEGADPLANTRAEIESVLKKVMSRTERLATVGGAKGMLRSVVNADIGVSVEDLKAYLRLDATAAAIGAPDSMEYWKSAAYPLNFMDSYKLKERLRNALETGDVNPQLETALKNLGDSSLPFLALESYQAIPLSNSRLRYLSQQMESMHAFELLWLPPSAPYYQPGAAYGKALDAGISKRLVFSSWHIVPRSIAALLSYESERRVFTSDEDAPVNDANARRHRRGLLRFSRSEGRLTGLPVLTLLYPSRTLAELCDPAAYLTDDSKIDAQSAEVLAWAESRVRERLIGLVELAHPGEAADESWYWVAPMMLERAQYREAVETWWSQSNLADVWSGKSFDERSDSADLGWHDHVAYATEFALGRERPSGKAPHDLPRVLALIGLGGPATCALRALLRLYPAKPNRGISQRAAATQIAWGFRSLFNRPESMALVRSGNRDEPYWRLCLRHSVLGCLSAVMDEYIHVLRDASGLVSATAQDACRELAQAAMAALSVRTATLDVDEIGGDVSSGRPILNKRPMRALFAMRFGSDKTEDNKQVQRDYSVRTAFNSPFWPFVLATTSVGQEGLDFHWYCHAIVHWNLPSNPVELEQREGRVHRFKGHAVRKNVGREFLSSVATNSNPDFWSQMFEEANNAAVDNGRGLIPYWLYSSEGGAWIERHVPLYPLSKDAIRYQGLQRALGAYRMVFGQPRQDELLAYLFDKVSSDKLVEYAELARIDLAPPRAVGPAGSAKSKNLKIDLL